MPQLQHAVVATTLALYAGVSPIRGVGCQNSCSVESRGGPVLPLPTLNRFQLLLLSHGARVHIRTYARTPLSLQSSVCGCAMTRSMCFTPKARLWARHNSHAISIQLGPCSKTSKQLSRIHISCESHAALMSTVTTNGTLHNQTSYE